jgi:DNA replication and repair protein RecF
LGSGKSFRTASSSETISFPSELARISGEIVSPNLDLKTDLRVELSRKARTRFFVHEKDSKLSDGYLGKLIVVSFVPSDTEIIRGGPSERRKFLDKHLVDIYPSHLNTLIRYQKALKSKLAILGSGAAKASLLDPWDSILAETAAQITATREQFITDLGEHIGVILPLIAPKDGEVGLNLKKTSLECESLIPSAEDYYKAFLAIRPREIASERALIGPHRDDLSITLSGMQSREFSSQGQARTLTLLLKLGVIELIESKTKESPIVLLDDVDSELDEGRARFLFNVFAEKERQIFISSTTRSDLWPREANIFEIADGQIKG